MAYTLQDLIRACLASDKELAEALKGLAKKYGGLKSFSISTGIPLSTLNKISAGKDMRLSTLRRLINEIRRLEGYVEGKLVIAIIASRSVLDSVKSRTVKVEGREFLLKEYPSTTFEDAIVSAIEAERDGASAIICAPIMASTLARLITIPIAQMIPEDDVIKKAAKILTHKIQYLQD